MLGGDFIKRVKQYIEIHKSALIQFFLNLVILLPLLVFGGKNFSVDSYIILQDNQIHVDAFIGSYRWFGAFIYTMFTSNGYNPILNSSLDIIIFIVLAAVACTILSRQLVSLLNSNESLNHILVNLGVLISFMNVWFCSILSFPECVFITSIGLILCFGSIIVFINRSGMKGYLLSGVLLICSTGVYQQFISLFTIYIIGICSIKVVQLRKKSVLEILKCYTDPALLVICSGLIYLLVGKVTQAISGIAPNSRVSLSVSSIMDNIIYFASNQHSYIKGRGFFDCELLTLCFLTIVIVWFALILYKLYQKHLTLASIILLCVTSISAYVSAYLPGILSTSHAARAIFAFFSIFILFTLGIITLTKSRVIKFFLLMTLILVLGSNTVKTVSCEMNLKAQNSIDREWATSVLQAMNEYESQSAITIKEIYYCYDNEFNMKTIKQSYSESAVLANYSIESLLEYYAQQEFIIQEMPEDLKLQYFPDNNWEQFNKNEQFLFKKNALYVCCY